MSSFDSKSFAGGLFGGVTGVTASHWADTIRVHYQENGKYTSVRSCALDIYKRDGLRGFYRGWTPPLLGIGFEKCLIFGTYDNIKRQKLFGPNIYSNVFGAGVISGLICTSIVAPIEKVKIMLQEGKVVKPMEMLRKNGIMSFYKGWTATLLREPLGYGVYFWTYEVLKRRQKDITSCRAFLFGSLSGLHSWIYIYPADPIKTRMQNCDMTLKGAVHQIYKEHGIKGFYRGFSIGCLRAIPMHGGVFVGYEFFMKLI